MSRILLLGCSLAMGSWGRAPHYTPDKPELLDYLCDEQCWYHFIPQLKGSQIDAYGIGGGSWSDWAQIMMEFDATGYITHFDRVIIAETTDDRFSLWRHDHQWWCVESNINDIKVRHFRSFPPTVNIITIHPDPMLSILSQYGFDPADDRIQRLVVDIGVNKSWSKMADMSKHMVDHICEKNHVPITVFSFFNQQLQATRANIQRLGCNLYDTVLTSNKAFLTEGYQVRMMAHPTALGNKAIGQYLADCWT